MRNLFGAHERSAAQWCSLATSTGLDLTELRPCDAVRSIIQLRPRPMNG